MTLLASFASSGMVVQASDRRLTYPDGSVADDQANKAVCAFCADAAVAFAYTGLALIGLQRTDEYLLDRLIAIRAPHKSITDVIQELTDVLTSDFRGSRILSLPRSIRRLSVVGVGLRRSDSFIVQVSNFEQWKPSETRSQAKDLFEAEWKIEGGDKRALALMLNGDTNAVSESEISKLRALRRRRFFHNNSGEVVANRLVKLIRAASQAQSSARRTIGQNCMSVWFSKGQSEVRTRYHDVGEGARSYMPNVIHQIGAARDIEMELPPGFTATLFGPATGRGSETE